VLSPQHVVVRAHEIIVIAYFFLVVVSSHRLIML